MQNVFQYARIWYTIIAILGFLLVWHPCHLLAGNAASLGRCSWEGRCLAWLGSFGKSTLPQINFESNAALVGRFSGYMLDWERVVFIHGPRCMGRCCRSFCGTCAWATNQDKSGLSCSSKISTSFFLQSLTWGRFATWWSDFLRKTRPRS